MRIHLICIVLAACSTKSSTMPDAMIVDGGTSTDATTSTSDAGALPKAILDSTSVSANARIASIAVDATSVYTVERIGSSGTSLSAHVHSVALAGGSVRDLGDQGGSATAVAVDDNDVFFCRADGVYAMPKIGGSLRTVAASTGNACERRFGSGGPAPSLIRDDAYVYWIEDTKDVHRVLSTGGTSTTILSNALTLGIAIENGQLFASDSDGITRANVDGTSPTRIFDRTTSLPDGLFVSGADLYFLTSDGNAVNRLSVGGGASTVIGFVPGTTSQYATDGASLWLADTGAPPTLYRALTIGSLPQAIAILPATNGPYSAGIVLAPGLVVWADDFGVYTLPR